MLSKTLAGFAGRSVASCAVGALVAAAALPCSLCVTFSSAQAQSATPLPTIPVDTQKKKKKVKPPVRRAPEVRQGVDTENDEAAAQTATRQREISATLNGSSLREQDIAPQRPQTNDTASLLNNTPGVSLYQGGGVSSLPSIHGLADDRVKIDINGMTITSACGNHMNPPLSYIDPSAVQVMDVMAGVTPVSAGGDSIAGTIQVVNLPPEFASTPGEIVTHASFSAYARSNPATTGGSASGSIATNNLSAKYTGAWVRAASYYSGDDQFIAGSGYEMNSHLLSLAARGRGDLLSVDLGYQHIPYQYFPNQPMDMSGNDAWYVNARYEKKFDWGKLYLKGFYHQTVHEMDTLPEHWPDGVESHMLMNTEGYDAGYSVKAEIPVSAWSLLRVGNEFHHEWLNDWYPRINPGMVLPQDFIGVNNGTRDRVGTFAEWEARWSRQWTTLVGVRNDVVWMDTGDVQGYSNSFYNRYWADRFNNAEHARTDVNFDVTGQVRYESTATAAYELGLSRKTRSPNLYERYSWWDHNTMISWFGDGNGYHGNLDLKPETAYTASFTVDLHDRARKDWQVKVTPYYTHVDDYIGVVYEPNPVFPTYSGGLLFVNHAAELYGVDVAGRFTLLDDPLKGRLTLSGIVGYVHGEDLDNHTGLYHMMPFNAKLALEHKWGNWTNAVEFQLVDSKTNVDEVRMEPMTPGYGLVNLRTSYEWEHIRLDAGVQNLFDQQYYHPLGGLNVMDYNANWWATSGAYRPPLASPGRNFYVGLTMKF